MWQTAPDHAPAVAGALLALAAWALLRVGARLASPRSAAVRRWRDRLLAAPVSLRLGAGLAVLSGGAHLALIPHHQADPTTATLFLIDGLALLILAPAAFTRLPWRLPAAVLLVGTVLAYLVYLVAGLEGPDQVGLASKLIEIAALGLLLVPAERRPAMRWLRWSAVVGGVPALMVLTGLTVWGVDLARPGAGHQHPGAVLQVTNRQATPEQAAAAQRLMQETSAAIAPYEDPRKAVAAGYHPGGGGGAVHWMNADFQNHGPALDPRRPQGLVYVSSRQGPVLVGAMFQGRHLGDFGPDPGGPLTAWHQHEHVCFTVVGGLAFSLETPYATCPLGSLSISAPPMLHVWIVPNPGGPFAMDLSPAVIKSIESS